MSTNACFREAALQHSLGADHLLWAVPVECWGRLARYIWVCHRMTDPVPAHEKRSALCIEVVIKKLTSRIVRQHFFRHDRPMVEGREG